MATVLPPARDAHHKDDLLGVCAALGEVSGIAPLLFRIGFVLAMLGLSFEGALVVYGVAGLAVQVARHWPAQPGGEQPKRRNLTKW